jgi:hypothetical protein
MAADWRGPHRTLDLHGQAVGEFITVIWIAVCKPVTALLTLGLRLGPIVM